MSLLNLNLNQLLTCEIKRSRNRFTSPLGKWFGTSQQDLSMEGGPFSIFSIKKFSPLIRALKSGGESKWKPWIESMFTMID